MFSVGVTAFILLSGYEPFYGDDNNGLLKANKHAEYAFHSPEWDDINPLAKVRKRNKSCVIYYLLFIIYYLWIYNNKQ